MVVFSMRKNIVYLQSKLKFNKMLTSIFLAQPAGSSTGMFNIILFAGIILVFYFFMLRPQQKKQKLQNQFINGIQKGDEVVTSSGIIGKVTLVEEHFVTIQIDPKTFMKVLKSAISKEMTDSVKGITPKES